VTGRQQEMAAPEHTALLLKCYTKLKDFTTLEVLGKHTDFFCGEISNVKKVVFHGDDGLKDIVCLDRIEWWFHDNPLGIDFDVVVMSAVFHGE
jgi:hypothetical protein